MGVARMNVLTMIAMFLGAITVASIPLMIMAVSERPRSRRDVRCPICNYGSSGYGEKMDGLHFCPKCKNYSAVAR